MPLPLSGSGFFNSRISAPATRPNQLIYHAGNQSSLIFVHALMSIPAEYRVCTGLEKPKINTYGLITKFRTINRLRISPVFFSKPVLTPFYHVSY